MVRDLSVRQEVVGSNSNHCMCLFFVLIFLTKILWYRMEPSQVPKESLKYRLFYPMNNVLGLFSNSNLILILYI